MPSRVLKLFVGVEDRLFDGWAFISWQYACALIYIIESERANAIALLAGGYAGSILRFASPTLRVNLPLAVLRSLKTC
ncbi:hypothetical protein [aff. Roholtiella sp. LEGE 12411]|uniref:hypothetical protein n=1 Tax=aff. Roholtiella sp. LEGE 12411 TaxID=1828822 RepID=UPI0018829FAE|nr:hypothetical protein [aff. Roholtiella sp. LEGE 12411]MBE9039040.1 hypothetical protein [aff. Roholtiella sp. LEGE 12411]